MAAGGSHCTKLCKNEHNANWERKTKPDKKPAKKHHKQANHHYAQMSKVKQVKRYAHAHLSCVFSARK